MEVIEGTSVRLSEEGVQSDWHGDSPFFLMIERNAESGNLGIDLDEPGWVARNQEVFREPGTWWLCHKASGRPVLCLVVEQGEQAYFVKHHVGNLMAGTELTAYGIGKKVPAKHVGEGKRRKIVSATHYERLWILPNGVVCTGDDVDVIASKMLE